MLAKAVAAEWKHTFFNITSEAIMPQWYGESGKLIQYQ
jgi:SpoVK/Ycf46/Vps4 family AAA+-type ATPase